MAKTKDLNAAIKELKKNYTKVLKEAVQYATEEAEKDINTKALKCLDEYYANHKNNSYDRTYSLKKAFVPYMNVKSNGTNLISTVGVAYDEWILENYAASSYYDASKKYGHVDGGWVLDNYLKGVHPETDGTSIASAVTPAEYYFEITDPISPTQKMDEYLNNYRETFEDNMYAYLAAYIMK